MARSLSILCLSLLLSSFLAPSKCSTLPTAVSGLAYGYYSKSCPNAAQIVSQEVQSFLSSNKSQAGAVVRLLFHDCFVQGCDASLLINDTSGEQAAPPNGSLRPEALKLMEQIKEKLEASCPNTVSCADIIAMAGSAAVHQVGGPSFDVPTGRLDSLDFTGSSTAASDLPRPTATVTQLITAFGALNLDTADLVALSGAHTIGTAHCATFNDSILPTINSGLDASFAQSLLKVCPTSSANGLTNLDFKTPTAFDNQYFINLLNGEGLLDSDRTLLNDSTALAAVQSFASSQSSFFSQFAISFVKMSMVSVKTVSNGNNGNIRQVCSVLNPTTSTSNTTTSSLNMMYSAEDTLYVREEGVQAK